MIDYKNIADNDPGGDLDVAYEAMKKETVKSYPTKMMTYLDIANLLDLSKSKELQDAVVGIADIPEFVDHELKSGGLDVNDVKSQYMLLMQLLASQVTCQPGQTMMTLREQA